MPGRPTATVPPPWTGAARSTTMTSACHHPLLGSWDPPQRRILRTGLIHGQDVHRRPLPPQQSANSLTVIVNNCVVKFWSCPRAPKRPQRQRWPAEIDLLARVRLHYHACTASRGARPGTHPPRRACGSSVGCGQIVSENKKVAVAWMAAFRVETRGNAPKIQTIGKILKMRFGLRPILNLGPRRRGGLLSLVQSAVV